MQKNDLIKLDDTIFRVLQIESDIHVFQTQKELDDWLNYTKEQALFNTRNYIERVEIPAAVAEEMLAVFNYYDSPDGLYLKTRYRKSKRNRSNIPKR